MEKSEQATAYFAQGYACSQSVFLPYALEYGLPQDVAARVAAGFGGGIGRSGLVCGAVTGAVMVLSLHNGNATGADQAAKERLYAQIQQLMSEFRELHGATACSALLGHDMSSVEERNLARAEGRFSNLCPTLVRDAAQIVAKILAS